MPGLNAKMQEMHFLTTGALLAGLLRARAPLLRASLNLATFCFSFIPRMLTAAIWWYAEGRVKVFPLLTQNTILSDIMWSRITSHLGLPRTDKSGTLSSRHQRACSVGNATHWTHHIMPNEMSLYIVYHRNDRNTKEITLYSDCVIELYSAKKEIFIFPYH